MLAWKAGASWARWILLRGLLDGCSLAVGRFFVGLLDSCSWAVGRGFQAAQPLIARFTRRARAGGRLQFRIASTLAMLREKMRVVTNLRVQVPFKPRCGLWNDTRAQGGYHPILVTP